MHITHPFVSGKADGTDATLVKPTNWNADHKITTDADAVVLGRAAGAGPGDVQELTFGSFLPPGVVMLTAGAAAPTGWLICDGALLLRSAYTQLFAVIGTAYDTTVDINHFRVPNLQGRVAAGVDPTGGVLTSATIAPNGATLGGVGGIQATSVSVVRASLSVSDNYSYVSNVNDFAEGRVDTNGVSMDGPNAEVAAASSGNGAAGMAHTHSNVVTRAYGVGAVLRSTAVGGSPGAVDYTLVQPTLLLNYIIKT